MSIDDNIRGEKGVIRHDKIRLPERLLLKIGRKNNNMFYHSDNMYLQETKLKKEELTTPDVFRVPVAQLDRAAAF